MKRLALFIGGVALAALALVPAAAADKPIRAPLPAGDFVLEDVCAFDVGVQILTNKEIGTTFSDGRFLITGSFKVRLTKLGAPPNTSLDVNISGPGLFTPKANGGTLITAWGNWLWWFFPGEIAPTGALILTSGHATEILDAGGTPVSFTPPNNSTDACALLASA